MKKTIEIPEGYEARIEDNKVILEPKESEDEGIRKAIHIYFDWLDGRKDYAPKGKYTIKDMISWIEKQGEHIKFLESIQIGDEVTRNPDGVLVNLSQLKRVAKQGEQNLANSEKTCKDEPKFKVGDWVVTEDGKVNQVKSVSDDGDAYTLDDGTYFSGSWKDMYHLWTVEDAKDGDVLYNAEHNYILIYKRQIRTKDFVSYCRLSLDVYTFYTCEEFEWGDLIWNPATKEHCDLLFQKIKEEGYKWDAEKKELKKVEPKFKVGDWVIGRATNNEPRQISEITDQCYKSTYDGQYGFSFEDEMHLWTIEDAKNGDILYTPKGCGVEGIFLIGDWKQVDYTGRTLCSNIGYRIEDDEIIAGGLGAIWWKGVIDPFYPATKKQRDLLFQKIKEAGYEWDAEKKELKKIKQKHAPKHRVGDTIYYNSFGELKSMIVSNVFTNSTDNPMYEDKEGNAVFEKDIIEQNPAWSEEDEEMIKCLNNCLDELEEENGWDYVYVNNKNVELSKVRKWIHSIKERHT